MTFHSQRIAIDGVDLNVIVEGQGPDVLLVHGFPDDHQVWRHQIPALVQAGYRVIAPDTRGCGDSAVPPRVADYRIDRLVDDLIGVLDALGVKKVKLVGHDWGAVIAWWLCMRHPERVERYAALSVGHLSAYARGPLMQKLKGWYIAFFQLRGLAEWALRAGQWWLLRRFSRFPSEAPRWIAQLGRPGRLTAAINYYRANIALVIPRALPTVRVPVMGVFSTRDAFLVEQQMLDTPRYLTGPWRYECLPGVSHWMQLEAPDHVSALLLDYLR